jgi:hypothetical protein
MRCEQADVREKVVLDLFENTQDESRHDRWPNPIEESA